jgi:hypothetical protein
MNYCIARLLLLAPLLALSCLAAGQESLVLSLKTHVPLAARAQRPEYTRPTLRKDNLLATRPAGWWDR